MPVFVQENLFDEDGVDVRPIGHDEARNLILHVHYARRIPSISYAYGLFVDGSLTGIVTYGMPASPSLCEGLAGKGNKDSVLELNRLVILDGAPKNSASTLVGRSLRMLPRGLFIVSYADNGGWGHIGYVYQATNWLYTGITHERTDASLGDGKHSRHYDKDDLGSRSLRTSKHRYVFVTAHGRQRRKMIREIRFPILDHYPKGDSRRYDTDNPEPANPMVGKTFRKAS